MHILSVLYHISAPAVFFQLSSLSAVAICCQFLYVKEGSIGVATLWIFPFSNTGLPVMVGPYPLCILGSVHTLMVPGIGEIGGEQL